MSTAAGGGGLFSQCRICLIVSEKFDQSAAEEVADKITANGGETVLHPASLALTDFQEFTYFVSSTVDFPDYDAICASLIAVVKPQWVSFSLGKSRLANPRQYNPNPQMFMNDVVVTCKDIPEGDQEAIIGGVLALGGLYSSKLTTNTTHYVSLQIEPEEYEIVKRAGIKPVLPHWFDDCLKLRKRLDERPYTLPDAEILRASGSDPIQPSASPHVIGASSPIPSIHIFDGRTLMLSQDLGINDHLQQSICDLVTRGNGKTTDNIAQADIYVCRYREGAEFQKALRLNKEIGNIAWLFHMITHNTWTSPRRRLLHYPIPRQGVPGFRGLKISLSNYAGEARLYLENLLKISGAEYTRSLRDINTHLVTAHGVSEKVTAAKEWNIHIVNHLWLEESYAKCQLQPESNPRYTYFPHRTNLTDVVGQTEIDRSAIETNFLSDPNETETETEDMDEDVAHHVKPSTMAANQDVTEPSTNSATATPGIPRTSPSLSREGQSAEPPAVSTPLNKVTKLTEKSASKSNRKSIQTPLSRVVSGQESETPSSTRSRKSKDQATARIHDIAPDIALYEREKKRVGGVIYGGRHKSEDGASHEEVKATPGSSKKRSLKTNDHGRESTVTDEDAHDSKKAKKTGKQSIQMHLLITGFKRWVNEPKLEMSDKRRLRELGIAVVNDVKRCTHVAAPSILRTPKFLSAIAYAPTILDISYITACIEKGEFLDPNLYLLKDTTNEERYSLTLADAQERAKKNKQRLLAGKIIYCVENIAGGYDVFKSIIESNGGTCILFRGRPGSVSAAASRRDRDRDRDNHRHHRHSPAPARNRVNSNDEDNDSDDEDDDVNEEVFLISGDSEDRNNAKLWSKFGQQARDAKKVPRIVKFEWLLETVLAQEMRWKASWELMGAGEEAGAGAGGRGSSVAES